jgi:hypothetical protein
MFISIVALSLAGLTAIAAFVVLARVALDYQDKREANEIDETNEGDGGNEGDEGVQVGINSDAESAAPVTPRDIARTLVATAIFVGLVAMSASLFGPTGTFLADALKELH